MFVLKMDFKFFVKVILVIQKWSFFTVLEQKMGRITT